MNPEQSQKQPSRRSMKADMPAVFAFVQDMREAFGKAEIDALIRGALEDGLPTFWAREGGHEVGVRSQTPARVVSAAQMVIVPPPQEDPHGRC